MDIIDQIDAQLLRLDPEDDDGTRTRVAVYGDDINVWCGRGEPEDPVIFDATHACALLALLAMIPDGAPVEEGVDGSLWEILLEADSNGWAAAERYARKHGAAR